MVLRASLHCSHVTLEIKLQIEQNEDSVSIQPSPLTRRGREQGILSEESKKTEQTADWFYGSRDGKMGYTANHKNRRAARWVSHQGTQPKSLFVDRTQMQLVGPCQSHLPSKHPDLLL